MDIFKTSKHNFCLTAGSESYRAGSLEFQIFQMFDINFTSEKSFF